MFDAYEIIRSDEIKEYKSLAVMLRHKKSGARVFIMSNDDDNKVFAIAFRTPPSDSTGVAHILEHSVLCGSKKFPSKDPFVELAKGSMNTFLNAMTYPDKTIYPVASCNGRDFKNLMDVYMDAVLHPNIYREEKIFRQEGWHYEMDDPEGELTLNGVVYNEMKGAFSNADEVIELKIKQSLFPDNAYSNESGGDPEVIPELTYGDFLEFHKKYYHPSNSYIFLYGDCDMEERLQWLDKEYLSEYEATEVNSAVFKHAPFLSPREEEIKLPITKEQSEDEESCLAVGIVCGDGGDAELKLKLDVLEYALIKTPGAPLRQALIDAGVAADVYGGVEQDLRQNYFSIIAKSAGAEKKDEFLRVIRETIENLAAKGLDRDMLKAGLNSIEFSTREGDSGRFPKGLILGLSTIGVWMYDEEEVFKNLAYEKLFADVKKELDDGGFERLLKEYFLDNPHSVIITASAEKGLQKKEDEQIAAKLKALKESWSEEKREMICRQTAELDAWQEAEDAEEDLLKIPMLGRGDLRRKIQPFFGELIHGDGIAGAYAASAKKGSFMPDIFYSDIYTSGIVYYNFMYDVGDCTEKELLYLGLLSRVFGLFDTKNYSYPALSNKIDMESGGMSVRLSFTDKHDADGEFTLAFDIAMKVFDDKAAFPFEILPEILYRTDWSSDKRLKELLDENRYGMQAELMGAGHIAAMRRCGACHNRSLYAKELTDGIEFYRFLEDAAANFEDKKDEIRAGVTAAAKKAFDPKRMLLSVTCQKNTFDKVPKLLASSELVKSDDTESAVSFGSRRCEYRMEQKNEAFITPGSISFVAESGNFKAAGFDFDSRLNVLKTIMSYDFLWNRVRVRGGAYGAMCSFSRDGEIGFVSYRDPNLTETLQVYGETVDFVENFNVSERDMTKYLIGTMSALDIPLSPMAKGQRNLSMYIYGGSAEEEQEKRDAILDVTAADIRALAPLIRSALKDADICVIGNEMKIKECAELFDRVSSLAKARITSRGARKFML